MTGTVLVTGAQGFIGRYTVAALLRQPVTSVVGTGRSPRSDSTFTHQVFSHGAERAALLAEDLRTALQDPRYSYHSADITDVKRLSEVIRDTRPSAIIHLASTRREESTEHLNSGNVQGTRALIDACEASGVQVKQIALGSSGSVYGDPLELPLIETSPCRPTDTYAASKLASEHLASALCRRAGIELSIGRIFNVAGPAQEERHVCGRFASLLAAIKEGRKEPVIATGGLSVTRDFIDVRDVAAAMIHVAEHGTDGEVYNIASGVETSIGEVLDILVDESGMRRQVHVEQGGSHTGAARHFANISKLSALGFRNQFNLRQSLRDILWYYLTLIAAAGCPMV